MYSLFLPVPFIALSGWESPKEANVAWRMNRWEVGRVLVKGEVFMEALEGRGVLVGSQQVAIGCVRVGMFQVRSVGIECGSCRWPTWSPGA